MKQKIYWGLGIVLLFLLAILVIACQGAIGPEGPEGPAGQQGPQGPQGAPAPMPPGPELTLIITKTDIPADRKPVVTFKLTDAAGNPLTIDDLDKLAIPGAMPARFTIAYLKEDAQTGLTEWLSYVLVPAKGTPYVYQGKEKAPAIAEGTQPSILMDMGGSYQKVGDGIYTYTFATVLPENYDRSATHRVGGEAAREQRKYVANDTFDFVPAGGEVRLTRQVVATESCNQCHDPLALHGGLRRDTKLCVVCHTSQNVDLETGNTAQFKVMIHKIHRGANLPSVKAGEPYLQKGFGPAPVDFSKVIFPQFGGSAIGEVRNCTTCHGAPPAGMKAEDYAKLAPNASNYKNYPSAAACGSCHENVDLATGRPRYGGTRKHPEAGPQKDDTQCASCHEADSGEEFDGSVVGAHTIPAESKQLKGLNVQIIRVTNTAPGQRPTVVFSVKNDAGRVVPVSALASLSFNLKGPTTDYLGPITTEAAVLANISTDAEGNYTYTLAQAISANATGSYALGIEAGRNETITGNEGKPLDVSVRSYNPVAYIPVTDKVAVPRRQVVATEKCNVCHKEIAFHGGGRKNTAEYCQLCHNPANVDVPAQVPGTLGGPYDVPPQSINFRFMIHRIHTGEELTRDFTIYRTRGVFNFNEVEFPGDRRNCAKCHVKESYMLPLPATNANTLAPREFYSPLGPAASACLGCHDTKKAAAHASTMTSAFGEACAACHGKGREFAVEKVHDPSKSRQEVFSAVHRATGYGSFVADNGNTFTFGFSVMQLDGKGNAVGEYEHRNTTTGTLIVVNVRYMKLVGNELWLGGTITKSVGAEGQPGEDRVIRFQDNFPGTDQRTRMQRLSADEALESLKTGNLDDANLRPLVSGNIQAH